MLSLVVLVRIGIIFYCHEAAWYFGVLVPDLDLDQLQQIWQPLSCIY